MKDFVCAGVSFCIGAGLVYLICRGFNVATALACLGGVVLFRVLFVFSQCRRRCLRRRVMSSLSVISHEGVDSQVAVNIEVWLTEKGYEVLDNQMGVYHLHSS